EENKTTSETSKIIIAGKEIPWNIIADVLRYCENKPSNKGEKYKQIWQARLLSKAWKKIADRVILEDKLLRISLSPFINKNDCSSKEIKALEGIAPLVRQISFIQWHESFKNLYEALTLCPFPNVQLISYQQAY